MPDGHKRDTFIVRSAEIEKLSETVENAGYVFEIEMLSDYATISMECVNERDEDDVIASEIVPNGPEVPLAVDRLVQVAAHALSLKV